MYPRSQFGTAPVISVCRHPQNSNAIVVADLSRDVESLVQWPEERIREALFKPDNPERPPLKEIRINRCPFVAGIEVLTEENWSRLGFDAKVIQERQRRLNRPGIAQKLMRVYGKPKFEAARDVEAALYDSFLDEADKARCRSLQAELAEGRWLDLDYADRRLRILAGRLKARSFPELMNPEERADWHSFVAEKLTAGDAPWLTRQGFERRLEELEVVWAGVADSAEAARATAILHALRSHAGRLRQEYGM
jgi:exodeoxyribonuclease-1